MKTPHFQLNPTSQIITKKEMFRSMWAFSVCPCHGLGKNEKGEWVFSE